MRVTIETFGDRERRAIQQTRDADNAMGYEDAQVRCPNCSGEYDADGLCPACEPRDLRSPWAGTASEYDIDPDFALAIADDLDRLTAEADDPYGDLGDLLDEVA